MIAMYDRSHNNSGTDRTADQAKYSYAATTSKLADLQYRLGELAAAGRLDAEESKRLQDSVVQIWELLYAGTLGAVRDEDTPDDTWDTQDNTYSDGRPVLVQSRIEPLEYSDWAWEFNKFMLGDGAVAERPLGAVYVINPIHGWDSPPGKDGHGVRSLLDS